MLRKISLIERIRSDEHVVRNTLELIDSFAATNGVMERTPNTAVATVFTRLVVRRPHSVKLATPMT